VSTAAGNCRVFQSDRDAPMTGTITLDTAIANYPHVRAIRDGWVASPLIRFDFEEVANITRRSRRMVRTLDFDLCEIALTTLAQAHAFGKPIKALPIVVMRGFHHAALVCPMGSAIRRSEDLRGKRPECGRGRRRRASGCEEFCSMTRPRKHRSAPAN
jgi:hypothetical protein